MDTFDYVIVGAGSAGCVLANRLSADPSVRVLLLEAGPPDTLDTIQVPVLWTGLFGSEVDWDYRLEPQTHYAGSDLYPRGKTLGGSSAINAMFYIRGHRTDFDGWTDPPDDCKSAGELPRVREMLEAKGLSRPEVEAVLGTNARRILRDGWR